MSRVLVLQHVESEGLGIIAKSLRQKRVAADFIKIFRDERIPRRINGYDGLIVLGGPMGVYEEDIHPFIKHEIALIKNALKNDMPILGICLGAQLLAKAAGADVYKGKKKEIGWYTVTLTDEGKRDTLFIGLPDEFAVFQWHGDTFDLGTDLKSVPSKCLASSELFPHQIIRVGKKAYGLQFHIEVTGEMIKQWIDVNDKELAGVKSYINPEEILEITPDCIKTIHRYGTAVFNRFFGLIA
ncbi:MAG: type 1 glutamine amidotransferase [Deltaproteobacteria bacterium]|nr:type 1 glutamine amidotransferase [Deltaproteobacteria bacterium]